MHDGNCSGGVCKTDAGAKEQGCCGGAKCGSGGYFGGMHGMHKRPFLILLVLAVTVWVGFKARNEARQYDYIGVPLERNVITVTGEGKVVGMPDIATIDLGMTVEKKTVAEAQKENTRVMNALIDALKAADVAKEDIQTSGYSVFASYDWNDGRQTLRGYTVSQNVHVKIRDLSKVGDIIGTAGQLGTNQIGGVNFTVDEPEALKAEARDKAIADAKAKAEALSRSAGITLKKIISFSENQNGSPIPMYYKEGAMGIGGAVDAAPTIQPGSSEFTSNVSITYEIR